MLRWLRTPRSKTYETSHETFTSIAAVAADDYGSERISVFGLETAERQSPGPGPQPLPTGGLNIRRAHRMAYELAIFGPPRRELDVATMTNADAVSAPSRWQLVVALNTAVHANCGPATLAALLRETAKGSPIGPSLRKWAAAIEKQSGVDDALPVLASRVLRVPKSGAEPVLRPASDAVGSRAFARKILETRPNAVRGDELDTMIAVAVSEGVVADPTELEERLQWLDVILDAHVRRHGDAAPSVSYATQRDNSREWRPLIYRRIGAYVPVVTAPVPPPYSAEPHAEIGASQAGLASVVRSVSLASVLLRWCAPPTWAELVEVATAEGIEQGDLRTRLEFVVSQLAGRVDDPAFQLSWRVSRALKSCPLPPAYPGIL